MGNNGCCLLRVQEKGQGKAGQGRASLRQPLLASPALSHQLSPLLLILTSSSGSLPLHPAGHPGNQRYSVLGILTRRSCFLIAPRFLHHLPGKGLEVACLVPSPPSHTAPLHPQVPHYLISSLDRQLAPHSVSPAPLPPYPTRHPGPHASRKPALQPTFLEPPIPASSQLHPSLLPRYQHHVQGFLVSPLPLCSLSLISSLWTLKRPFQIPDQTMIFSSLKSLRCFL